MLNRFLGYFLVSFCSFAYGADRPNFVWIVSEDNSIHYLKHFFPGGAETPNIERLAAEGLTYDHAFSNAPVCSVARTTLITGCYGPRIGTQFHRRYQLAPMPEGLRMFPAYLREAGYYTSNNRKKDYNAIEGKGVWDESSAKASWRNRATPDQPFFHFQSHAQSHESSLHFNRHTYENEPTETNPDSIDLADYHPDTPLFRYTHARYHDRMKVIDGIVGDTVAKLEEDGLLEETFIFYFGDHGGVLPGSKGYPTEAGLHVPLVVRVPEKFQHLVGSKAGERVSGFVSFIDFGPTLLNLAGLPIPDEVDGRPFLGANVVPEEVAQRDTSFGYADRFDEKYEFIRTLRKGRYQYLRYYQPYLPDGLNNNYRYKNLAYAQWRSLFEAGELEGSSRAFFEPKHVEHLYDCEADPHQVKNLANDSRYADVLLELRSALQQQVRQLPDLSFYPESYLVKHAMDNPVEFGQAKSHEIAGLVSIADLALRPFDRVRGQLQEALASNKVMERYWAAMVCTSFGEKAKSLSSNAWPLLDDESAIVRLRAIEFLGSLGEMNPQPMLIHLVNSVQDSVVATEALNSVVWFRDFFEGRYPVERSQFNPEKLGADVEDRLNYINGDPYPKKR